MLYLISPAKKLDYRSPLQQTAYTQPLFLEHSKGLIDLLKTYSKEEVSQLMSLSDALAQLNVDRYHSWVEQMTLDNARPAIFAFDGDVYDGLDAKTLNPSQLDWLQTHLRILSGLYGVLRPYDLMQPYRLEMGTKLPNPRGRDLYAYWGSLLADYVQSVVEQMDEQILINLCSQEYFKSIRQDRIQVPIVDCVFKDYKNGIYKIISFNAKRARGAMLRFAVDHQIDQVEGLKDFNALGYCFEPKVSTSSTLVFYRKN